MREILFRGKRNDNGNWIYGSFHKKANNVFIIPLPIVTSQSKVVPETVGQFTGLIDKNDKQIFEGDIVKRFWLGMEIIYQVKYECKYARFIGEALNTKGFTTFEGDGELFEIIGNIYDNPDILKRE